MKWRTRVAVMVGTGLMACQAIPAMAQEKRPGFALIPAGSFEMGDHHGFVDPKHGGDETPVHTVRLDAFYMGVYDVTNREFCAFLNSALAQRQIEVRNGGVHLAGGNDLLCETRGMSPYSRIGWDGKAFSVLDGKENHPVVCIRWFGAAAYCNWLGAQKKLPPCYSTATWECDFNKSGFRLPTEAEWEYAARGGQQSPYRKFPCGDEADATQANWPESKNPFRAGPEPWTTPVGFFNGKLQRKSDFGWPGAQETYQTADGANGYGLYDMTGNVWQFINDWYVRDYYAYSPAKNPPGPASGSLMPDGKAYRGMRGGNWYNGENGHGRVSNRNPSYFRGPKDPDHPYYHLGFRVVLPVAAESRPVIKPTPVQKVERGGATQAQSAPVADEPKPPRSGSFSLASSVLKADGLLPVEFTGDGAGISPPVEWKGAPAGTKAYALIMHHMAPDQVKWYWILYNIPAAAQGLPKDAKGVGTMGGNSVNNRIGYAPPHSKGPGLKTYACTVYALSEPLSLVLDPEEVTRDVLLAAMKGKILDSAELKISYCRPDSALGAEEKQRAGGERPPRGPRDSRNGPERQPESNGEENP